VVPPMHPAERGQLNVFDGAPGTFVLVVDEPRREESRGRFQNWRIPPVSATNPVR
jgi:hypothetical protein